MNYSECQKVFYLYCHFQNKKDLCLALTLLITVDHISIGSFGVYFKHRHGGSEWNDLFNCHSLSIVYDDDYDNDGHSLYFYVQVVQIENYKSIFLIESLLMISDTLPRLQNWFHYYSRCHRS